MVEKYTYENLDSTDKNVVFNQQQWAYDADIRRNDG